MAAAREASTAGLLRPIRVLVVDDSVVMRRLVSRALSEDKAFEVAGFAADGAMALSRLAQLAPDVVVLDIEMPGMNGLEALRRMRRLYPDVRVIVLSALTEPGTAMALEALLAGADDYVSKPSGLGSPEASLAQLRAELGARIKQFFFNLPEPQRPACASCFAVVPFGLRRPQVVAVGASTGGPKALATILPALPGDFPLPVLVVQHMPPLFTRLLASHLSSLCALPVEEAGQGSPVKPGKILVAPGDYHMVLEGSAGRVSVRLERTPPENCCRPSVDVLFRSVAEVYGGDAIAVVLTGMGQDGLRGAGILKRHGAFVIAQDEASSVVWGMPGAIVEAGLADRVASLRQLAREIIEAACIPASGGRS